VAPLPAAGTSAGSRGCADGEHGGVSRRAQPGGRLARLIEVEKLITDVD
jgi:hypothetical protein